MCGLPTGTGKSLVIAMFCYRVLTMWASQRIAMLTHDKKLIQQNRDELLSLWPQAPVGIYSTGLKKKEAAMPIVFGGVASLHRNPKVLGHRDILIIDECHLLSPDENTMYQKIIKELKELNPYLKVIGFSATLYRMRQGSLADNGLFTDICYDMTTEDKFNLLVAEGFICPLFTKPTRTEIDVTGVQLNNQGEFKEDQLATRLEKVLYQGAIEACELGKDRHTWLAFACNEDTTEKLASMLNYNGVRTTAVYSKLGDEECDKRIAAYKRGDYRCIVNMKMLTTGFNLKRIDYLIDMAPTRSPGLHVQKCGRGTRISEHKIDCLYADFARNTARNGPINNPRLPTKPGAQAGEMPTKNCPKCGVMNHATARECWNSECKHKFEMKVWITPDASTDPIMSGEKPEIEYFEVMYVSYAKHQKRNEPEKKPTLKVTYICGMKSFTEWISIQADGYAGRRAKDWWRQRAGFDPPTTVDEALKMTGHLKKPSAIRVWTNRGKYAEIRGYEY